MKARHIVFNPIFGDLQAILESVQVDGYVLSHIVAGTSEYEAVAIFIKPDKLGAEGDEEDPETGYL